MLAETSRADPVRRTAVKTFKSDSGLIRFGLTIALALAGNATIAQLPRPLDPIAAKLEPSRHVVYKRVEGRELKLHLFYPDGHRPQQRRAVFLMIHGGGWTGGTVRRTYPFLDHFAQLGMVGVGLEYRLLSSGPETTVFDCVKDARSAVRYLRKQAADLGMNPDAFAVAGASAGAHLAAGTSMFEGMDDEGDDRSISCMPNALVLYYPVIDTSSEGYGQSKIGERWRNLSPLHQVKPGLPPTILFHGTADTVTPYSGAQSFWERMKQAGNRCELISHEGGRHGYLIFDLKSFENSISRTEVFLESLDLIKRP